MEVRLPKNKTSFNVWEVGLRGIGRLNNRLPTKNQKIFLKQHYYKKRKIFSQWTMNINKRLMFWANSGALSRSEQIFRRERSVSDLSEPSKNRKANEVAAADEREMLGAYLEAKKKDFYI